MREAGIFLLFLLTVVLPLYYFHSWLKKSIVPERSFPRLFLYLFTSLAIAGIWIVLFGWLILRVFFPGLRVH